MADPRAYEAYEAWLNRPTVRHRAGLWLGRLADRWCVRGYGYGSFRNGFAAGYRERGEPHG